MKKIFGIILIINIIIISGFNFLNAQDEGKKEKKPQLESENIQKDSKDLDEQILDITRKIEKVLKDYKMLDQKNVRILPFQVEYELGKDFIKIERHVFIRSDIAGPIVGSKRKSIKIFTNGTGISKLVSEIQVRNYNSSIYSKITIVDPSPLSEGTDDITFTQELNGRKLLENYPLKDVKNTTAFPIRNDLKREFYVLHLMYFYNTFLNIAETYYKNLKDGDNFLFHSLIDSTKY